MASKSLLSFNSMHRINKYGTVVSIQKTTKGKVFWISNVLTETSAHKIQNKIEIFVLLKMIKSLL